MQHATFVFMNEFQACPCAWEWDDVNCALKTLLSVQTQIFWYSSAQNSLFLCLDSCIIRSVKSCSSVREDLAQVSFNEHLILGKSDHFNYLIILVRER